MTDELDPHQQAVFRQRLVKAAYEALEKAADDVQELAPYRRPGAIRSALVIKHVNDAGPSVPLSDREMLRRIYRRCGAERFAALVRDIQDES